MPDARLTDAWFARYLRLLGVPPRQPGRDGLFELTEAHVTRVPFENISKLYYHRTEGLRGVPDPDRFLEGIARHHFGGTCYANASYFNRLLAHLGYDVTLCGAAMSAPDVHIVNIVTVEGRPWLVDVGYGAPLYGPLPLDVAHDQEVVWGRERYVLKPRDADGRPRLDLYRDGPLRHGYLINTTPRRFEEFASVVADSFADHATFMNAVRVSRFWPARSVTLSNLALIETEGPRFTTRRIPGRALLPQIIEEQFEIPADIARQALEGVNLNEKS